MSGSTLRRRALLSGTMLMAAAVGYGRRAYAACVNTGGATYQCSGAETTTQTISANNAAVSTLPGFSVNAAAGNGITITGAGALSYTDTNASPLTAPGTALYVFSGADYAGTSTPGSVTIDTNGALSGGTNGAPSGGYGIFARNYGTGALTITANGDVTGSNGTGIGILATSHGTSLSVTTGAGTTVSGGTQGINARNYGTGALTITANGDVTGTSNDGIFAKNSAAGSNLSVTTGANTTVSGGSVGIFVRNYGTGALTITANGDVTGGTGDAIYAKSTAAPIDITVAATSTVTSTAAFAIETSGAAATVTVAGTVAGSMKIGGTLTFQPGAVYKVFVSPATASLATVTGTATLAGTVNASFAAGSYVQKQYTILTAAGGLGGTTFSTLSTVDLPAGFRASLSYDADDVFLNLIASLSASGLNGNQGNVANAINTFFNNGGALPPGFVTLASLTGNALGNGLSQLSGEAGASTTQGAFDATNQFMSLLLDPFNDGHFGADGADGGALGYAAAPNDEASQAYAAVTPRDRRAVKAPAFAARWGVWASGYGGSSKVSGDAAAGAHDTTTSRIYGMAAGADYHLSPDTVLGFSLGGAGFNFGLSDGLGGGHADLFQAGLYGRHFIGHAYVAGALAYGWQDVTTDRTVTVAGTDKLEAEFHPQTFAARLEGGYRFATPWLGVTPYGALQVTSFHSPAYAEHATSGSDQFALSYDSETTTNWRTELGARFDKSFLVTGGLLTLRARLAWAHDSNTDRPAVATFQTLPGASFTVNGAEPAADGALISVGTQMRWRNGFSLAGSFEGEFSNTTQSYAGKGTLRYVFN